LRPRVSTAETSLLHAAARQIPELRLLARTGADVSASLRRARAVAAVAIALAVAGALIDGSATGGAPASEPVGRSLQAQPVIGLPVEKPVLIGSSPGESAGETWGYATTGSGEFQIVRYVPPSGSATGGGWQIQPGPLDASGLALTGFKPAPGPLGGRTTPNGGVAIVGEDAAKADQLLVRNPDGAFAETPPPPGEPGETLFAPFGEGVLMAPVDQAGGPTAVFLVPFEPGTGPQSSVLFYDGKAWTREPICAGSTEPGGGCEQPPAGFRVLALDATSTENAWLLAQTGASGDALALFHRTTAGGKARWVRRRLGPPGSLGASFEQTAHSFEDPSTHSHVSVNVAPRTSGQPLTVTGEGVWIDGRLTISGQSEPTDFTLYYDIAQGAVAASWCSPPAVAAAALCTDPLEASLPEGPYRSFAWSGEGPFGRRAIAGLRNGVTLELAGARFEPVLGLGGEAGTNAGAAFSSPREGWLADSRQLPLTHLSAQSAPDLLQPWPVPFRRPLTAIATQPGMVAGNVNAQAIAVGARGQVGHYFPDEGWVDEALLDSGGHAQTPELRGVAWPEAGRAYAVGTHGSMWLWQSATGLWEPDPARPPNLFLANFTGIAFDPSDPSRGYAVGQQGVLLGYGKTWAQEKLPAGLEGPDGADFLSIAFAGKEAIATYKIPTSFSSVHYAGGILINDGDGSGWHADTQAEEALGEGIPLRVAGLPDGGAAIASGSKVIERQAAGAPWQPAPAGPFGGTPVALSSFREAGTLRVVVSVDTLTGLGTEGIDEALREPPPEGQASVVTEPYPLPSSGYLLRETPTGWEDLEHKDYPTPNGSRAPSSHLDWPYQPDAVLALALDPEGGQGWAVGGQTGEANAILPGSGQEHAEQIQTAGVMRYPANGAPPAGFSSAPEQTSADSATFAIGGGAQCESACSELRNDQIGPDEWLANALRSAAAIRKSSPGGLRAFLYTGSHLAPGLASLPAGHGFNAQSFQGEESSYARLLTSSAESLPVFAAPSESDLDQSGTLASFGEAFQALAPPQGTAAADPGIKSVSNASAEAPYFSFESTGAGGSVRVIVLNYSKPTLGTLQQCWLAQELAQAAHPPNQEQPPEPALVIGARDLTSAGGAERAADASQVIPILVNGTPPASDGKTPPASCTLEKGDTPAGASAYFFDSPERNRVFTLSSGSASIRAYGSGTLGYIVPPGQIDTEFLGASGYLLVEANAARRMEPTYRGVRVKLVPDISELAVAATNGVLLRRSQSALFQALARRPHAGMLCRFTAGYCNLDPDPYVPIPTICQGASCATGIFPEYAFASSNPDIGDFVEPDPASSEGTTVLQGANGKPIHDEHSGLFCAYNPGTTTITVRTGGLSASMPVTVLAGSVEQPCGTTRLLNPPAPVREAGLPAPVPPPAPAAAPGVAPSATLPPPPPPPLVPPSPPARPQPPHGVPAQPLLPPAAQLFPLVALPPAPAPSAGRPTPPSGTAQVPAQSPVSQQVSVAEREEEEQGAIQHVHNMAAYRRPEEGPTPGWPLGLVLVAAAAGIGIRRGIRSPEPVYARSGPARRRAAQGPPQTG
jgi:hypothetical protein